MGSRRTHEEAAVAAARAAHLVGFASSSNLEAGRRYGVPTTGTSAHAFTLLHDDEQSGLPRAGGDARHRARRCSSTPTTSTQGIRTAVEVGRAGARRDPARLRRPADAGRARARELLDELGATRTRIVVTSDLDEYAIAGLMAAPVDGYGVGTSLVTGSGAPTAGMVYKLVERDGIPVAKKSEGKRSVGGRKHAVRRHDADGIATAEVVSSRRRRATGTATATSSSPWCAAARSASRCRRPTRWPGRGRTTSRRARRSRRRRSALSRGEPVLDTVTD